VARHSDAVCELVHEEATRFGNRTVPSALEFSAGIVSKRRAWFVVLFFSGLPGVGRPSPGVTVWGV